MPCDPQIYLLACTVRDKLCHEAAKESQDLGRLVAHANLLDKLLIELSPPGERAEIYGFGTLPENAAPVAPRTQTVVSVEETEDEEELESLRSATPMSPSTVPMLSHDAESESDSGSDSESDSDDGEDFTTVFAPGSPTDNHSTSVSGADGKPAPHRAKSGWRLLGL